MYGLIRQESRFITDARSGVGASGLMQVMPATAKWTAKKLGMGDFQAHHITDKDTNIAIGTGYLKLVLDSFAGSMPMAAAAYNAGPGRIAPLRKEAEAKGLDPNQWFNNVELIAAERVGQETVGYVRNIYKYYAAYKLQLETLEARKAALREAAGAK